MAKKAVVRSEREAELDRLAAPGLALEKKIERAGRAVSKARDVLVAETWEFADWLVENTIVLTPAEISAHSSGPREVRAEIAAAEGSVREVARRFGVSSSTVQRCRRASYVAVRSGLTCAEYGRRSGYSAPTLSQYRRVAGALPAPIRGGASLALCIKLFREFGGDAEAVVAVLPERVALAAAAGSAAVSAEGRLRAATSSVERRGVRSFADMVGLAKSSRGFLRTLVNGYSEAGLRLSDVEVAELAEIVAEIDLLLAELPVERPRRRLFSFLRAA